MDKKFRNACKLELGTVVCTCNPSYLGGSKFEVSLGTPYQYSISKNILSMHVKSNKVFNIKPVAIAVSHFLNLFCPIQPQTTSTHPLPIEKQNELTISSATLLAF